MMSKYTTQIRMLVNNNFDFNLKDYPIFDEDYRDTLNKFILDYYYMYEIEFETAALFNHYLGVTMQAIMPKYNMLYEQQKKLIESISIEVVETFTSTNQQDKVNTSETDSVVDVTVDNKTTSKSDSNDENRFSDTPMNDINNLDKYLSNASRSFNKSEDNTDNTSKSDSSSTASGKSDEKVSGSNDYVKKLMDPEKALKIMQDIKDKFINIDYEIVKELDILFFKMM